MDKIARYLADNIVALRKKLGMSQQQLAKLAQIPRSTLTHIESGSGNPSLSNLARLSFALQVGIEELLSRPRTECVLFEEASIPVQKRSQGKALVYKLLPDRVKGMEVDRMELAPMTTMPGRPHVTGAKEYLIVMRGEITVAVAGEQFTVPRGAVLAFPGDQAHAYRNLQAEPATGISVVIPVTLGN